MPVDRLFHPCIGDSNKIELLSDAEFRVWFFYVMAADDFGVLPLIAAKIQGADRSLGRRPARVIDKALEQIASIQLVRTFTHQSTAFAWSPTWQFHQKIRYPRREQTHYPMPPEDELRALTTKQTFGTRDLFATFHMRASPAFKDEFGDKEAIAKIEEREQKKSGKKTRRNSDVAGMEIEPTGSVSTLTRAGARETAHGSTPSAEVFEEKRTPPFDRWFEQLCADYPQNRVSFGFMTQSCFVDQFGKDSRSAEDVWVEMQANLENHKRSHEWRVKGMVPKLEKWLREGLWKQQHDEFPVSERVSNKTSRTLAAASAILRESH